MCAQMRETSEHPTLWVLEIPMHSCQSQNQEHWGNLTIKRLSKKKLSASQEELNSPSQRQVERRMAAGQMRWGPIQKLVHRKSSRFTGQLHQGKFQNGKMMLPLI